MDLKDFFSAAEARIDRWCEMSSVGRAWESAIAQGQPADKLLAEAAQLLGDIGPLEGYWAYPGSRLMATVRESLGEANAGVFARLVQKISNSLLTGGYRHDSGAWDPLQESDDPPARCLAAGRPDGREPQAVLRSAGGHAQRPEHMGTGAQRSEAPAPAGRYFSLRDRPGRQLRRRRHRHDLQLQRPGGGHL